ncbi:MAG: RluA family pseudouridine synthase [Planctomycetes bacterium]|nr:RluA family pseudouridine synthase [Planctomycetota bacterium]
MSARELPAPQSPTGLLQFLLVTLAPMNRTRVKQLLGSGRVLVNGQSTTRHDHPVQLSDRVSVAREVPVAPSPERAGFTIVFEDDSLIVIDKPPGLLTVATDTEKLDTAFARLSAQLAARNMGRPFVVHRLDRETSGLLLFARSEEVQQTLQTNWDAVTKTYLAVVEGVPKPPEGVVEDYLTEGQDLRVRASNRASRDGKLAITRYKVASLGRGCSLVEVTLETGRKHQIRVHMAGLGCPVAGDAMYRAKTDPAGRLALHAWRLAFDHPVTRKRIELESPLPEKLRRVVARR